MSSYNSQSANGTSGPAATPTGGKGAAAEFADMGRRLHLRLSKHYSRQKSSKAGAGVGSDASSEHEARAGAEAAADVAGDGGPVSAVAWPASEQALPAVDADMQLVLEREVPGVTPREFAEVGGVPVGEAALGGQGHAHERVGEWGPGGQVQGFV